MMSKFMMPKLAFVAIVLAMLNMAPVRANEDGMKMEKLQKVEMVEKMEKMEDSTVAPIADMAMLEEEMKTTTERPPMLEAPKQAEKPTAQRHTVADFIIHPLIAFKPRNPEDNGVAVSIGAAGKQADTQSTTTTTPSPWQLFGFNAGQGLGSTVTNSVSTLAGQVSGWLNDRIQFPGLVETPIRESTTTSTTTTTTTERPDVVVRVQHKATTRRPLISINDRNRPNLPQFESEENNNDDDDDDDEEEDEDEDEEEHEQVEGANNNEGNEEETEGNEQQQAHEANEEAEDNEENENSEDNNEENNESPAENNEENGESSVEEQNNNQAEHEEEEHGDDDDDDVNEEETVSQRPNNRRRPLRNKKGNANAKRKRVQNNKRRTPNRATNKRKQTKPQRPQRRRRPAAADVSNEIGDEEFYDDENEYAGNDDFYYDTNSKRSQSSTNFIQRGQQQLINQIRQLTRLGVPAELSANIRKVQQVSSNSSNNKRRQQATVLVNRNGQTFYLAPDLAQFQQLYAQPIVQRPVKTVSTFPQPPLTTPLKRKGQPTQYITIPWAQLGISPPNNLVSITEGIQGQPLILNIPQSAINAMQSQAINTSSKKKRPQLITPDAVPLLAEASLLDIFKPPQIPPSRTANLKKPSTFSLKSSNVTPVFLAAKPSTTSTKTTSVLLEQHIRPATIVEKAPEMADTKKSSETETSELKPADVSKIDTLRSDEKEYILVGNDNEPGLTRQAVQPVLGDARFVHLNGNSEYFDVPIPRRRFNLRRSGRELAEPVEMAAVEATIAEKTDQHIPVQVIHETEMAVPMSETAVVAEVLADPKPTEVAPLTVDESKQASIEHVIKTT